MNRRMFLCLALVLSGCQVHEEIHTNAIQHDRRKYVCAILMDTSGSFQSLLFGRDGRAYEFCMETAKDFHDEIGDDGTILLAQLSGNDDPLLWEGTPQQLMSSFSSAENLRDFIRSKSDPNASRLFGGLADAMAYLRRRADRTRSSAWSSSPTSSTTPQRRRRTASGSSRNCAASTNHRTASVCTTSPPRRCRCAASCSRKRDWMGQRRERSSTSQSTWYLGDEYL